MTRIPTDVFSIRHRLQTLRFYEAQKKLEEELAAEYKKNLQLQSEKYEDLHARELRMREDQLDREHSAKIQALQDASDEKCLEALQEQQEQLSVRHSILIHRI